MIEPNQASETMHCRLLPACTRTVELTLVVPTFNERGNVQSLVAALIPVLGGIQWEILFVDDNSPDGTAEQVRIAAAANACVRLLDRVGRRGLSSACIDGIQATVAPYIAVMDADLQHDERILPEMLRRLKCESLDMVVGSRAISGGSTGDLSWGRILLSRFGTKAARLVCHCQLSDPMSGFFMIRRQFFEKCVDHLEGTGFKLLLELLAASDAPPRIAEVPYTFRRRQQGRSKFGVGTGVAYLSFLGKEFVRLHETLGGGRALWSLSRWR